MKSKKARLPKSKRLKIKLPDILSEEIRNVVIGVKLSEQSQALPRLMTVADVVVEYDLLVSGKPEHRREDVKARVQFVKPGEEQTKPTPEVDKIAGLAQLVQKQVEAEEQAKRGDYTAAAAVMADLSQNFAARGLADLVKTSGKLCASM